MAETRILPDDILDTLLCNTCSKYLSVLPVKVYPNKKIKCGRCIKTNDSGAISIYNSVVMKFQFPCINRYDGCTELLLWNDVVNHETNCKSSKYECPIITCSQKKAFAPLDLLTHFRTHHENNLLLDKIQFTIDDLESHGNVYLHRKSNHLYWIILTSFDKHSAQISVNYINKDPVLYEVQVFSGHHKTYESKKGLSTKININNTQQNGKIDVYVKLKDSDVFSISSDKIVEGKPVIKNSEYVNKSIINARKKFGYELCLSTAGGDISLSECKTKVFLKNNPVSIVQCPNCCCMSSLVRLNFAKGIYNIQRSCCSLCTSSSTLKYLSFKCRFNCSGLFSAEDIRKHEAKCLSNCFLEAPDNYYVTIPYITNANFSLNNSSVMCTGSVRCDQIHQNE